VKHCIDPLTFSFMGCRTAESALRSLVSLAVSQEKQVDRFWSSTILELVRSFNFFFFHRIHLTQQNFSPIPENEGKPMFMPDDKKPVAQKLNHHDVSRIDSSPAKQPARPVPTPKPVAKRDAWEIPPIQCNGKKSARLN
jgi:hypothetical protein